MLTLSTCFTLVRCLLVPFIIMGLRAQAWLFSAILFAVAEVTDVVDGRLARMRNEVTRFGAMLDTVADKVMFLSIYGTLYSSGYCDVIPHWFLVTMLGKEIVQLIGFLWLILVVGQSIALDVSVFAKIGGFLQGLLVLWVLLGCTSSGFLTFLMGAIVVFALCSLMHYAIALSQCIKK